MKITAAIGGLAGACALTLINQVMAKVDNKAPRLDLLGMNAAAKLIGPHSAPRFVQNLFPMSMVGDLVSNTLYFGLATSSDKKRTLIRGALLGLGAGLGAVVLPKPMGLNAAPTNFAARTQGMTVLYYLIGGLVAAAVINVIDKPKTFSLEDAAVDLKDEVLA